MTARLVVVGDTLLDRDVDGAVTRLCPDAPAPVLDEQHSTDRAGGAGLAACLAAQQDLDVALVTGLAGDAGGARLSTLLAAHGVALHPVPLSGETPEKVRLRAAGRTVLRWDRGGQAGTGCGRPAEAALAAVRDASVVLVSDYGWSVSRQPALREALARTSAPVVWDPHPRGPAPVPNVRLATPNEEEVRRLVGADADGRAAGSDRDRMSGATRGADELRRRWRAEAVAVTMGELGAMLCRSGPAPQLVPAPAPATGDTCGAGDVFAVAAAAAVAGGARVAEAVADAVRRASAYVAAGGVQSLGAPAPVAADTEAQAAGDVVARVRARGGRVVATGGCFDLLHAGHVATLQAARQLGDCLVVCLNSDASVAGLKGAGRPLTPQADRSRVLAALECVDAVVVFDESTPHAVLSWLQPDVWVKGGDYADGGPELPEADLVQRWDGQTVLVPYLPGRSTTRLVAATRNGDHRR